MAPDPAYSGMLSACDFERSVKQTIILDSGSLKVKVTSGESVRCSQAVLVTVSFGDCVIR